MGPFYGDFDNYVLEQSGGTYPNETYTRREGMLGWFGWDYDVIDVGQVKLSPQHFDFGGEVLLGHLRYGTSGNFDSVSCHPYARKSIWPTRNLLVAGNFNLTNTAELNASLTQRGAHVIYSTDTQSILEEIGFWLDEEHDRLFKAFKDQGLSGEEVSAPVVEGEGGPFAAPVQRAGEPPLARRPLVEEARDEAGERPRGVDEAMCPSTHRGSDRSK